MHLIINFLFSFSQNHLHLHKSSLLPKTLLLMKVMVMLKCVSEVLFQCLQKLLLLEKHSQKMEHLIKPQVNSLNKKLPVLEFVNGKHVYIVSLLVIQLNPPNN